MIQTTEFPTEFRKDITTASIILRRLGAQAVFIFGSLLDDSGEKRAADIDIAVSGLPKDQFFHAYGQLLATLDHPFDLVDLEAESAFVTSLRESGRFAHVA